MDLRRSSKPFITPPTGVTVELKEVKQQQGNSQDVRAEETLYYHVLFDCF